MNGKDKYEELEKQFDKETTLKGRQKINGIVTFMLTKDIGDIFSILHEFKRKFYIFALIVFVAIVLGENIDFSKMIQLVAGVF